MEKQAYLDIDTKRINEYRAYFEHKKILRERLPKGYDARTMEEVLEYLEDQDMLNHRGKEFRLFLWKYSVRDKK